MFALILAAALSGQLPPVPIYVEVVTSGVAGPGTGQPLPGMHVMIAAGTEMSRGVTGSDGRFYPTERGTPRAGDIMVITVSDFFRRMTRMYHVRAVPGQPSIWINWAFDY